MICVPIPAVAGSKVPFEAFVIPVPLHVPPAVAADKLKEAAPTHTIVGCVMVALGIAKTVTKAVSKLPQFPLMV